MTGTVIKPEFFPLSVARRRGVGAAKRAALPAMRAIASRLDECVDTREVENSVE